MPAAGRDVPQPQPALTRAFRFSLEGDLMFNRILPFALVCALGSYVPVAAAQQQTAEGAQRFLALLAKDGHLNVGLPDKNGALMSVQGTRKTTYRWQNKGVPDNSRPGPYDDTSAPVTAPLKWLLVIRKLEGMNESANADACTTRAETTTTEKLGSTSSDSHWLTKETFFNVERLWYQTTITDEYEDPAVKYAGPHFFAWGRAVISRAANGRITARAPGLKFNTELVFLGDMVKDPDLADRVEYAMKFLKASCDKTAATGF
ncbi:hypothetical protein [Pelomonas sp. Root1444]|uniref:hypothetical protein n=1 Tax=Pelomonas sp. Root1444 TaxID=1736464 RepID=UPI000AE601BC|nr:hypothetical protein [Pelomonas sp. Root1444]